MVHAKSICTHQNKRGRYRTRLEINRLVISLFLFDVGLFFYPPPPAPIFRKSILITYFIHLVVFCFDDSSLIYGGKYKHLIFSQSNQNKFSHALQVDRYTESFVKRYTWSG